MPTYPSGIPTLITSFFADPLGSQKFVDMLAELQEIYDALGINPQGAFGTVAARLAEIDAKTTQLANFGLRNLQIANNVAAANTKVDVSCELIGIEGSIAAATALTIDITAAGKNGTAFTRTASTWYYIWLGMNPATGEVCGLLDNDATRAGVDTSHATLAGFSKWRRVGTVYNDATGPSGNFLRFQQFDQELVFAIDNANTVYYTDYAATDANFHDVTLKLVPATTRHVKILPYVQAIFAGDGNAIVQVIYRPNGDTGAGIWVFQHGPDPLTTGPINTGGAGVTAHTHGIAAAFGYLGVPGVAEYTVITDAAGVIELKWTSFTPAGNIVRIYTKGYRDSI